MILNASAIMKPWLLYMLTLLQRWLDEDAQKITDDTTPPSCKTWERHVGADSHKSGSESKDNHSIGMQPLLSATERLKQIQDEPKRKGYEKVGRSSDGSI